MLLCRTNLGQALRLSGTTFIKIVCIRLVNPSIMSPFTLSYDTMSYDVVSIWHSHYCFARERFVWKQFTFCSLQRLNLRSWLLKLDIAHLVHVIWVSDKWRSCILPRWSSYISTAQLYERCINIHTGEKGSRTRRLSFEMLVHPSFQYTFLYMTFT